MTPVLRYARYMGPDTESIYGHAQFCGSCRRKLGGSYDSPLGTCRDEYPEALEAACERPGGHGLLLSADRGTFVHWMFCPWCGAAFDEEWWRDQPVQNERAIDHYCNPGTHAGDSHVFPADADADPSEVMAGHWLACSSGELCPCDPIVTPGLMGCEIEHRPWSDAPRNARGQESEG